MRVAVMVVSSLALTGCFYGGVKLERANAKLKDAIVTLDEAKPRLDAECINPKADMEPAQAEELIEFCNPIIADYERLVGIKADLQDAIIKTEQQERNVENLKYLTDIAEGAINSFKASFEKLPSLKGAKTAEK